MKVGVFLLGVGIIMIISLAAFAGLIFYFDPFQAGIFIIILVFLTLLFGLTGFLTLVGYIFRRLLSSKNYAMQDAAASFWQGSLIALAVVSTLVLLSKI